MDIHPRAKLGLAARRELCEAIAAVVVPATDQVLDAPASSLFTLVGAVCFLIAAGLLVPSARRALAPGRA